MDSGADRLTEHGQHGGAFQMLDAYLERPTRHAAGLLDRLSERRIAAVYPAGAHYQAARTVQLQAIR